MTPEQIRALAMDAVMAAENADRRAQTGHALRYRKMANALRTAADQLEVVQALSDSWKREGVAPDFWVELNRALRSPDITPRA